MQILRYAHIFRYAWAAPNTIAAITVGLILFARFRIVDGAVEMHGPAVKWALSRMPVPALAMTVGHAIFGQSPWALDHTRKHEHVHVKQYGRWGPLFVPLYLGWSAYLHLRGRDGYRENPFEVEAYAVDDPSKR